MNEGYSIFDLQGGRAQLKTAPTDTGPWRHILAHIIKRMSHHLASTLR